MLFDVSSLKVFWFIFAVSLLINASTKSHCTPNIKLLVLFPELTLFAKFCACVLVTYVYGYASAFVTGTVVGTGYFPSTCSSILVLLVPIPASYLPT